MLLSLSVCWPTFLHPLYGRINHIPCPSLPCILRLDAYLSKSTSQSLTSCAPTSQLQDEHCAADAREDDRSSSCPVWSPFFGSVEPSLSSPSTSRHVAVSASSSTPSVPFLSLDESYSCTTTNSLTTIAPSITSSECSSLSSTEKEGQKVFLTGPPPFPVIDI